MFCGKNGFEFIYRRPALIILLLLGLLFFRNNYKLGFIIFIILNICVNNFQFV